MIVNKNKNKIILELLYLINVFESIKVRGINEDPLQFITIRGGRGFRVTPPGPLLAYTGNIKIINTTTCHARLQIPV